MAVKVSLFKNQVIHFGVDLSEATLKKALMADPEANLLYTDKGQLVFKLEFGEAPGISDFGVTLNEKQDIIIINEKPTTKEQVLAKYEAPIHHLNKVLKQIEAAAKTVTGKIEVTEVA